MADLGTLALGTFSIVSNTAITGTEPVLQVIASADDNTNVHDTSNTIHTGEASFTLGDVPADFGNIDTVSVRLRYAWASGTQTNTWNSLRAQIVRSDGSTALTDEVIVASTITTATPTNSSVIPMTNPDTAANKTVWDGALVRIRFNISKVKGGDALEERVFAGEITGTYTASAISEADGSSAGTSTAAAAGAAIALAQGVSAGVASSSVVGSSFWLATGSSSVVASVSADGTAIVQTEGASAGTSTATADGEDAAGGPVEADGSSSGVATVSGVGAALWNSTASAQGNAEGLGVGGSTWLSVAAAAGIASVSGDGENAASMGGSYPCHVEQLKVGRTALQGDSISIG